MKSFMNKASLILVSLSVFAAAPCWAGWGAIVCSNNSGACTWAQGAPDYDMAVNIAMNRCEEEYGNCVLERWEHNECVSEQASNGAIAQACY